MNKEFMLEVFHAIAPYKVILCIIIILFVLLMDVKIRLLLQSL